jgi:hypothetical protein
MIPFIVVIVSCLVLGIGHIGWAFVYPLKALKAANVDPVITASLHACWYHISLIFFATAGLLVWHLTVQVISSGVLVLLGALIFSCWLTYLGTLLFHPKLWRIAWFQMILIPVLLGNLAYGIDHLQPIA